MKTWAVLCLAVLIGWPMAAPAQTTHTLPLVRPADFAGQESLVRIVNRSDTSGTVQVTAIDDTGERFGPVTLTLGARQALNITSTDWERGNAAKGLPVGVGDGEGSWRLDLATALTIEPLAYIRTPDGFLTSMHDVAPESEGGGHWVPFFNPGSNTTKVSHLRIINPGTTEAAVTVTGRDDGGNEASGTVSLTLPAGAARTLTAQALEAGGEGFDGSLGDGAGKWRLSVRSSADIQVMSLLATQTQHLANLSTAPSFVDDGITPPPPDDHGDTEATATIIDEPRFVIEGRLETPNDIDYFRIRVWGDDDPLQRGLFVRTTGNTDTFGTATFPGIILSDDDGGEDDNFLIFGPRRYRGIWYVSVRGGRNHFRNTGRYTLRHGSNYGAIAGKWVGRFCQIEDCHPVTAMATNAPTLSAAVATAIRICNEELARISQPQNCELYTTFDAAETATNSNCGALAVGIERSTRLNTMVMVAGDNAGFLNKAELHALETCTQHLYGPFHDIIEDGFKACRIARSGCAL